MDRRESIKTMLIGALGTGALLNRCAPSKAERTKLQNVYDFSSYGRTAEEKQRDVDLFAENFFTDHQFETVAVLCDLILPATDTLGLLPMHMYRLYRFYGKRCSQLAG